MPLHANKECSHDDPVVLEMRRLQDADDSHGVLKEVHRLQASGITLSDLQKVQVTLHESGALLSLGAVSHEEFIKSVGSCAEWCVTQDDHKGVGELGAWCVQMLIEAGCTERARVLAGTWFEPLRREAAVCAFEDIAKALIAESDGDADAALLMYQNALQRLVQRNDPCEYEFIAKQCARLVWRIEPAIAKRILRKADIPESKIGSIVASFA